MESKRSVWVMSWLKNRLETSEFNNILNLLKTEKKYTFTFCNYLNYTFL